MPVLFVVELKLCFRTMQYLCEIKNVFVIIGREDSPTAFKTSDWFLLFERYWNEFLQMLLLSFRSAPVTDTISVLALPELRLF